VVTDVADAAGYRRLEEEGVTDLITMPWALYGRRFAGASLEQKIDGMKRFAGEIMARMN
jgi:hypothetical protein